MHMHALKYYAQAVGLKKGDENLMFNIARVFYHKDLLVQVLLAKSTGSQSQFDRCLLHVELLEGMILGYNEPAI